MAELDGIEVVEVSGRRIIVRGIGRLFFEHGLPIGMSVRKAEEDGFEVSWLHIADDLLKNGIPPDSVLSKIREEASDSALGTVDMVAVEMFVWMDYDDQRAMIFEYLFGDRETALAWGRANIRFHG